MILPLMRFMPPLLKKFSAPQLIAATAVLAAGGYLLNFFAGDNMGLLCVAVTGFLLHLSGYPAMSAPPEKKWCSSPKP